MTDKTRENLTNAIRPLVRELMDNPNVTDEDLAAMGLPPRGNMTNVISVKANPVLTPCSSTSSQLR